MHLERDADLSEEVDALATSHGGRVGLEAVYDDLDRRVRRTLAPGRFVHRAWTWDRADRADRRWWPQGVTVDPTRDRRLVVSWYAKDGGSRLTFVDLESRRYRHVLLVTSRGEQLRVHAGGIAWQGSYLHVAATGRGFWTCHVDDVLRGPEGYVLPARLGHRFVVSESSERLRCSFLSVDPAPGAPALLIGEYGGGSQTHRLARVDLDPDGLPVREVSVVEGGVVRAQGVAVATGEHVVTASHGTRMPGSLWVGRPGEMRRRRYAVPMGPEDLAYDPATDLLWTVTEHPHRRWIVAIRRNRLVG